MNFVGAALHGDIKMVSINSYVLYVFVDLDVHAITVLGQQNT
jgi:hypothetical protein